MDSTDDLDQLDRIRLFRGLARDELERLRPFLHRVVRGPRSRAVRVTELGKTVYLLVRGTVKVYRNQLDGSEVILAFLGPGDVIGELSLLDRAGPSAEAVAVEESVLLAMAGPVFRDAVATNPRICYNLAELLAERLRQADEHIQALAALDVTGRVSRQILAFARRYGEEGPAREIRIPLRLTQSDLANMVGASRERVNQVMKELRQMGVVSVDSSHHISIQNADALSSCCC